jgi:vacuolar-type H+-ATPase subunit E/Vma4
VSYEKLIAALLEEGEARCREILRKARTTADQVLADAARAADTLERQAEQSVRADLARQRAAALTRASLERRRLLLQAKHRVLDAVWARVTELAAALTGPLRTRIVTAFIEELLRAAPPGPLTVIIDPRERAGLTLPVDGRSLTVEEQRRDDLLLGAELVGSGAILRTSLSARLAKAKPALLPELNRMLFGSSSP